MDTPFIVLSKIYHVYHEIDEFYDVLLILLYQYLNGTFVLIMLLIF